MTLPLEAGMGYPDTNAQTETTAEGLNMHALAGWATPLLLLSISFLAVAPILVGDSYSIIEHTISESGGQGVEGAWAMRIGTLLTSAAVFIMSGSARGYWSSAATFWMRMYALGLVFLVAFPESPWEGGDYNATVARLHTVAGVFAAASFFFGAASLSRTRTSRSARAWDWFVMAVIALTPQVMLLAVEIDGLLQRIMISVGYVWLVLESRRVGMVALTKSVDAS